MRIDRNQSGGSPSPVREAHRTPYQRVADSGILAAAKHTELQALLARLNPATLTRDITTIQTQLINLAAAK